MAFSASGAAWAAANDEDFIELCGSGTIREIRSAVQAGANVNVKNEAGRTALDLARASGN